MADLEARRRPEQPESSRSRLRLALQTRSALRQAIVLAEILAPPVARRTPRAPGSRSIHRGQNSVP